VGKAKLRDIVPRHFEDGAQRRLSTNARCAVMCFDIPHNSLRATLTPDQMRSRVAGAHSSINYGIRPLGALTGGLLGSWIGVRETLLVSATGGACAILWLINSPIIRLHDLNTLESPRNKPAPAT
jgi:hypothetical protein